jgi:tetratricopeptide (TPR) repeat protein
MGEYELALDAFLQSLEIRRALKDSVNVARVLSNIGKTYQDWEQFDRARPVLEEAVATAEAVDAPLVLGYALNTQALLMSDIGAQPTARAMIERSLALYASRNPPETLTDSASSGWALNLIALGVVEMRDGDPTRAITLLGDVLRVAMGGGDARSQARTRLHIGQAWRAKGDLAAAAREMSEARRIASGTKQRVIALEALRGLAEIEEARGNPMAALGAMRAADALRDTVFARSTAQRIAVMESRMERDRQQRETARLLEEQRAQEATILRQRVIGLFGAFVLVLGGVVVVQLARFGRRGLEREALLSEANTALERTNGELRTALSEVRTLKGLIPICANCKKVRDDRGFWEGVESYISSRSDAMFSHSICTSCGPELYGDAWHTDDPGAAPGAPAGGGVS